MKKLQDIMFHFRNGHSLASTLPSSESRRSSMKHNILKWFQRIWTLVLLTSCTPVGTDFKQPEPPLVNQYTRTKPQNISVVYNQPLPKQWWQLFHSTALNQLMDQAMANNQDLAEAMATLRKAEQDRNAVAGTQLPQIDADFGATPTRVAPVQYGIDFPANNFVLYNASVNVSYNLDIWGGLKRQIEAYNALAQYQAYQMKGAALTLTGNVSTAVFKLALLNEQRSNTEAIIKAKQNLLNIAQKQQAAGGLNQIDLNNIANDLSQSKMDIQNIQKDFEQTQNQLAVYLGVPPSSIPLWHFKLNQFSNVRQIPMSMPSELIRHRPDILAAESLLHQANANVGVAISNMYPQINITGTGGAIAAQTSWKDYTTDWVGSIGPSLYLPMFNGGTLEAQKKSAIANFEVALANYKQTVLEGFQNVADCLTALETDTKNLKEQEITYQKTHKNLQIIQKQLKIGGASQSQWLNAQIADYQALTAKFEAQSLLLSDTAALFQAVGGGWWS